MGCAGRTRETIIFRVSCRVRARAGRAAQRFWRQRLGLVMEGRDPHRNSHFPQLFAGGTVGPSRGMTGIRVAFCLKRRFPHPGPSPRRRWRSCRSQNEQTPAHRRRRLDEHGFDDHSRAHASLRRDGPCEAFRDQFRRQGCNQAVAAAKLGAEVVMVTNLGDDALGESALNNFHDYGSSRGMSAASRTSRPARRRSSSTRGRRRSDLHRRGGGRRPELSGRRAPARRSRGAISSCCSSDPA